MDNDISMTGFNKERVSKKLRTELDFGLRPSLQREFHTSPRTDEFKNCRLYNKLFRRYLKLITSTAHTCCCLKRHVVSFLMVIAILGQSQPCKYVLFSFTCSPIRWSLEIWNFKSIPSWFGVVIYIKFSIQQVETHVKL